MKGRLPYHRRFHGDAITGYMGLTLEERGAYSTLLDYLYDRRAPLIPNFRLLAGFLDVSVRKAEAVIESLIEKGKLYRLEDGSISNHRFEKELENSAKTSDDKAEIGRLGGLKSAEVRKKHKQNKDESKADANQGASLSTSTSRTTARKKKKKERSDTTGDATASSGGSTPPASLPPAVVEPTELVLAVQAYNEGAEKCPGGLGAGWAHCRTLTANREKAVRTRLKEVGLDGWRAAVARGAQSDFLSGRSKRSPGREKWGIDIGWLAKAENFAKLTEGKYDNDRGRAQLVGRESARAGLMDFLREEENQ